MGLDPAEQRPEGLGERDQIEGYGDGLRKIEGYSDGAADRGSERAADDVVFPSALDLEVGGDLGDRQTGGNGHGMADENQGNGSQEPHVSHGIAEPEEQDGAQDGADGGQEDGSRAESAGRVLRHDVALVMWEMVACHAVPVKRNVPAWVSSSEGGTMVAIENGDRSMRQGRTGEAA